MSILNKEVSFTNKRGSTVYCKCIITTLTHHCSTIIFHCLHMTGIHFSTTFKLTSGTSQYKTPSTNGSIWWSLSQVASSHVNNFRQRRSCESFHCRRRSKYTSATASCGAGNATSVCWSLWRRVLCRRGSLCLLQRGCYAVHGVWCGATWSGPNGGRYETAGACWTGRVRAPRYHAKWRLGTTSFWINHVSLCEVITKLCMCVYAANLLTTNNAMSGRGWYVIN